MGEFGGQELQETPGDMFLLSRVFTKNETYSPSALLKQKQMFYFVCSLGPQLFTELKTGLYKIDTVQDNKYFIYIWRHRNGKFKQKSNPIDNVLKMVSKVKISVS